MRLLGLLTEHGWGSVGDPQSSFTEKPSPNMDEGFPMRRWSPFPKSYPDFVH